MTEWKRVKIGEVCRIEKGATGIASATPGDYPLVVTALERKTCSTYQFDCEAVCIPLVSSSGHGKKSLKYVHYQNGKFALGTILAAVIPNGKNELSVRYLHQYLQFYKDTLIVPLMHGAANVSLAIRDIEQIEIPLPPIEKQNEFAKLFVRMQENDVEHQREFETQKDLIKKLRQSILQDAIEGKLTSQWRIENGKLKMGACASSASYDAGSVVSQNPRGNKKMLAPISDEEKPFKIPKSWKWAKKIDNGELRIDNFETPFKIPETWKWVRLGEIGSFVRGSGIKRNELIENGFPCIRYGELYTTYKTKFSETKSFIPKVLYDKSHKICYGDICMALTGENKIDIALAVVYEGQIPVAMGGDMTCFTSKKNNPLFLVFLINSSYGIKCKKNLATGDFICHISNDKLASILIPLPPLAEQNEIVRRVENQLAKVEQLEQQVQERENLTKSLFRGILKNAFEGE